MTIMLDTILLPSALKVTTTAWSPVMANSFFSGDGTLIVQQQLKKGGRKIVLSGERVGDGVMKNSMALYSLFLTLEALLVAGQTMTLALHGEEFSVTWDYEQTPLEYESILCRRPPAAADPVLITMRFMTLS